MNKITHSKLLNDFLSFYMETYINGEKRYESVIDYFNYVIYISDLKSLSEYDYEFAFKEESQVESLIRKEVENIVNNNIKGYKTVLIEGGTFSTLEGFYDEVEKKLVNQKWGRNLNAFNDILKGGFGTREYDEPFRLLWIESEKSKKDLSYEETIENLEIRLQNMSFIEEELKNSKAHIGKTIFDRIVGLIKDHNHIDFKLVKIHN
jgi:hypothetical protein